MIWMGPVGPETIERIWVMFFFGVVVMFQVFGCTIFSPVHLREYAVVIGSLVATLTELYEPFGINDNVWKLRGAGGAGGAGEPNPRSVNSTHVLCEAASSCICIHGSTAG